MKLISAAAALVIILCPHAELRGQQPAQPVPGNLIPSEFIKHIGIHGAELSRQWDGLLPLVNAPFQREKAFPGQHLTLSVAAKGKDRARLLQDAVYTFTVEFAGITKVFKDLHPIQIHRIKAEGADFVRYLQKEIRGESGDVDRMISGVDLALFNLDWVVPINARDGDAKVRGAVQTTGGRTIPLLEGKVQIRSFETAVKEGGFKDQTEVSDWMMGYYQHPEPSRLLNAFRLAGDDKFAFDLNEMEFYVEVLKSSPVAARFLLTRLKVENEVTRAYGLHLLREAKYDIAPLVASLPKGEQKIIHQFSSRVPVLPDPYDLTPNIKDLLQIPNRLDMLWSKFLATGDSKPVRAVAGVLEWSKEGKPFAEQQKSGKKIEGVTIEVVRGSAYGAAGWSLGSFVRNYGLVADFVETWKLDPSISPLLRAELNGLLANPAFKKE